MRLIEFASAEEQMGLWKLVSDNMWQAISTQVEQEKLEKAKKAAAAKAKPAKRGGGRKSAAKSAISVATPSPSKVKPVPAKTSDAQAADAAIAQSSKPEQQVQALKAQGPLPRMASVPIAPKQAKSQTATSTVQTQNPTTPQAVIPTKGPLGASNPTKSTAQLKLSARHGGVVNKAAPNYE